MMRKMWKTAERLLLCAALCVCMAGCSGREYDRVNLKTETDAGAKNAGADAEPVKIGENGTQGAGESGGGETQGAKESAGIIVNQSKETESGNDGADAGGAEDRNDGTDESGAEDRNDGTDAGGAEDRNDGTDAGGNGTQEEADGLSDYMFGADTYGRVLEFTGDGFKLLAIHAEVYEDGSINTWEAAPGHEKEEDMLYVICTEDTVFEVQYCSMSQQKELSREACTREDVKKQQVIYVWGISEDGKTWTADKVMVQKWR